MCEAPAYADHKEANFRLLKSDGIEVQINPLVLSKRWFPLLILGTLATGGYGALVAGPLALREERKLRGIQDIQCRNCGHTWAFNAEEPTAEHHTIDIVEAHMSTQSLGTEVRTFTNLSAVESEEKATFTQEWTKTWSIAYEEAKKSSGGLSGKTQIGAALKFDIEKQLKSNYAISESLKETATYERTFKVPPKSKIKVSVSWKRLFQHGVIKLCEQDGNEIEIPFKVAVRATYDIEQE